VAVRRQQPEDPLKQLLSSLGRGLWALIAWPFNGLGRSKPNEKLAQARAEFTAHWADIELMAATTGQQRQAIMQADILLDQALQFYKVSGQTLGERLKAAGGRLSKETLDTAWRGHKVRNHLAHELRYELRGSEAEQALADFKKVLRSLGLL